MNAPRLRLLQPDAWPEDMRHLAAGKFGAANVMKSLMHHPDLFRRWSIFANHFLFKGALPPHVREILILRTAWVTGSEYEWGQHVKLAAEECDFDESHFRDIQIGARAGRWTAPEKAMLRLADGLISGPKVSDRLWDYITDNWKEKEIIEAVALVGNYVMLAMALNTLGTPLDDGLEGFGAAASERPEFETGTGAPYAPRGAPRIPPLPIHSTDAETRALMTKARGDLPSVNVIDTVARHSGLLKRWLPFFSHCLHKQSLDLRQRELVILRTGWLAGSSYEWAQHVPIALERGVKPQEIEAITEGPEHPEWGGSDKAILEAVDALMARFTLSDAEWRRLATNVTTPKALDTIFTVGQYRLVAGLLLGLNVQLDGYLRFPPPLS